MAATKKTTEEKAATAKKKTQKSVKAAEEKNTFVHTEQQHVQRGDETVEQYRQRLQEIVDAYEKTVAEANDITEMEKDYREIQMRKTEMQERLKASSYNVSESAEYNGTNVTRKEVGEKIVLFVTKEPVGFPEIPTMKLIVDYWENPTDTIPFPVYDATVRTLDNVKYRGMMEWDGIMMVSAFFGTMSEPYSIDNITMSYWDAKAKVLETRAREISVK
jgi:hypothetical protein